MRVFIGITLPAHIRNHLFEVKRLIEQSTYQGNFTLIGNYHITLKYIGHASDEDIDTLENMIDYVSEMFEPFYIKLHEIGSFFKHRKHIVWMGVKDEEKNLHKLFESFEALMVENGFSLEQRKYHPHITIGKNILFSNQTSNTLLTGFHDNILIDKITLFWSHREHDVLTYTPIYQKELSN